MKLIFCFYLYAFVFNVHYLKSYSIMRKLLYIFIMIIICLFISRNLYAQNGNAFPANHPNRCGTMEHLAWLKQKYPSLQARMDKNEVSMCRHG